MARRTNLILCTLYLLAMAFSVLAVEDIYDGLVNKKVTRNIDLTSQVAKHTLTIEVLNNGNKVATEYHLTFGNPEHLSLVLASEKGRSLKLTKVGEETKNENKYALYRVDLATPLQPKETVTLKVEAHYIHAQTPFPTHIAQNERQFVRYADNHYVLSPYTTQEQTTTVKTFSSQIESKSELNPTNVRGDTITYGPYSEVKAFSVSPLNVHYENNSPFITVTRLVKTIEISHWGNIAIENEYFIRHDGAKLKGHFSRYDYQRGYGSAVAHVPVLREILPKTAADVYYRDEIGNISTSHLAVKERGLTLDMFPRFPLFGGWKINFLNGYNLPANEYLFRDYSDSSHLVLNITFSNAMDNVVIDELEVRVILPEGSKTPQAWVPFPIDGQRVENYATYLDTAGRTVLVIEKRNVVPSHNQFFQVTYYFSRTSMLQEPFLLIAAFFTTFVLIMLYVRFHFYIGPVRTRTPAEERAYNLIVRLQEILEQREELHASLDAAALKYTQTKQLNTYTNEFKAIDTQLANLRRDVSKLLADLETVDADRAKKVRDIEKREETKQQFHFKLAENEINRADRRLSEKEHGNTKSSVERQVYNLDDEIENIRNELVKGL